MVPVSMMLCIFITKSNDHKDRNLGIYELPTKLQVFDTLERADMPPSSP